MLAILISMLLETVVCQMNIIIAIWELVTVWGGSNVAILVHIDFLFLVDQDPNSNIKLSSFKQKRSFYVFLHDPTSVSGSRANEFNYIIQLIKYFDPSSLVSCSRFHQPYVISTMFHWCSLFGTETLLYLLVTLKELWCFRVVQTLRDQKGGRRRIEDIIACTSRLITLIIILLKRSNESSFGCQAL